MAAPKSSAVVAVVLLFTAAACGALVHRAGSPQPGGKKKMIKVELQRGDEYNTVAVASRPIRPGAPPPALPRAHPGGTDAYLRPYGDEHLNSRLPHRLPAGTLQVLWKQELNHDFPVLFVLQAADRIALYSGEWRLFDMAGKLLISERLAGGPLVLDPANACFYTFAEGYLGARALSDGKELFEFRPMLGDNYTRMSVARHGSRLLTVGWERALDPDSTERAEKSLLHLLDLGNPPRVDDMGTLESSSPLGALFVHWPTLMTAIHGDSIIAAASNQIYVIDWKLDVKAAWDGDFEPQSLSLDEAGRIYMNLRARNRSEMWLLTPKGERLYAFALPGGPFNLPIPPIVGYDHAAYILAGEQIYAVAPDGKLQWARAAAGTISGATVTAGDELLVSEGSGIAAYGPKGERRAVWNSPGEQLATPPVTTPGGTLLVASETTLYCLGVKQ